jgi:hypothetical protein
MSQDYSQIFLLSTFTGNLENYDLAACALLPQNFLLSQAVKPTFVLVALFFIWFNLD